MRYPLWAFFFVFVMPLFTAHALLVGNAAVVERQGETQQVALLEDVRTIHYHRF